MPKETPVTDATHQSVAQQVAAFCAAYVDQNFDPNKVPMINTDELIAAACKQFGIAGRAYQEVFEMREGYTFLMTLKYNR